MAIFLSRDQIYRMLQRELPEGVYPDGPPSGFFSTADMDSVADVVATGYGVMNNIYDNEFPQTTTDRIDDWVVKAFPFTFDDTVSLQEKRDRVIGKLRKIGSITLWEVLTLVASYLPEGKYVQLAEWGCGGASGWHLDADVLDGTTYLGSNFSFGDLGISADDWCGFLQNLQWRLDFGQLDVDTTLADPSWQEVSTIQADAFMYDIRIFDFEVTGTQFAKMVQEIDNAEPARSGHHIIQNLQLSDFGLTNTVNDVGQFSRVNCITRDPASSTGYTGKTV